MTINSAKYYLSAGTGSRKLDENFPLWSAESIKWLQSNCYQVARELNGEITLFDWSNERRSFVAVRINEKGNETTVLFNVFSPIIAFLNQDVKDIYMPSQFVLCERASSAFSMLTDFKVVPLAILQKQLEYDDWCELSDEVKEEIKYWRPYTVGEVIFNNWD